jgi:hypothetical protein
LSSIRRGPKTPSKGVELNQERTRSIVKKSQAQQEKDQKHDQKEPNLVKNTPKAQLRG